MGIETQTNVATPSCHPLSLYTELEDPSTTNMVFYSPQYGLWNVSQEPLDFHGHISWSLCKATFSIIITLNP